MDDDALDEGLEHAEFMDSIRKLQEEIFMAWLDRPAKHLVDKWFDLKTFGDEPAFTSLLFDKLIEEHNAHNG